MILACLTERFAAENLSSSALFTCFPIRQCERHAIELSHFLADVQLQSICDARLFDCGKRFRVNV